MRCARIFIINVCVCACTPEHLLCASVFGNDSVMIYASGFRR